MVFVPSSGSKAPPLTTARIITASMAMGVIGFWVVGYVVAASREPATAATFSEGSALGIWASLAIAGFFGAMFFRRRAIDSGNPPVVQTNLLIAHALLEGPALLSGVLLLLTGSERVLYAAAPVYLIGLALVFPRAEWFGKP
jgi:hypothetical protein